jgi:hypothetical protein
LYDKLAEGHKTDGHPGLLDGQFVAKNIETAILLRVNTQVPKQTKDIRWYRRQIQNKTGKCFVFAIQQGLIRGDDLV